MTKNKIVLVFPLLLAGIISFAQTHTFFNEAFPAGTVFHENIPYANDTLKKHLLDIYLPPNATSNTPVVIWIHGGAWMHNDKYADMSYMTGTIKAIMEKGYALASIDYRHSTTKVFPAQRFRIAIRPFNFYMTRLESINLIRIVLH